MRLMEYESVLGICSMGMGMCALLEAVVVIMPTRCCAVSSFMGPGDSAITPGTSPHKSFL